MGGTWGAEFSNTGLSGVVISGRAQRPVYLYIENDDVKIKGASHLWGKDTFEVNDLLQQETDKKTSVAAIGRAGERQVRMAGIVCDGRFGRVAARCGLGAVMGSKNLKAVVVRGRRRPKAIDEARLKATNKEVTQLLAGIRALGPQFDLKKAFALAHEIGDMGVKNQTLPRWDAFNKKFQESYDLGKHSYCRLCPQSCMESHLMDWKGQQVRAPVGQSLNPMGTNCLIDNFDALREGYDLCNRYGIDTISFGYTLAFAMEAFEKGLISRQDTGGIDLTWGNHEAMLEMIKQVGENEGFGKVLAQGSKRAAEQIGGDAIQYTMQVKGLEIAHWDPRMYNSLVIAYATGNKGASHFESPSHSVEKSPLENRPGGGSLVDLGYPPGLSRLGFEGKGALVKKIQDQTCLINSQLVCYFSGPVRTTHNLLSWLNSITGWDMKTEEFLQTGERIFNLKRLINLRRGLSSKDDTLPQRLLTKFPELSDEEQNIPISFEELLQEYYTLRGWDSNGSPTQEKLAELGLP